VRLDKSTFAGSGPRRWVVDNFGMWFFWTKQVLPSCSEGSITLRKHALEGCTSHSEARQMDLCRFRGWVVDNFGMWFFWTKRVLPSCSDGSITPRKQALEGCTSHSGARKIDLSRFRGWGVDNFGMWFFWTKQVLPSCSDGSITWRKHALQWCASHTEARQINLSRVGGWVADNFGKWFFWTKQVLPSCSYC